MQFSTSRILTTHTGSLPRPRELTRLYAERAGGGAADPAEIDRTGRDAVRQIVRKQCEAGVAFFKRQNPTIKALRDVSMPEVEAAEGELPDIVFRRCRHVVGEIARTTEAAHELGRQNYEEFGELMLQSHHSLRDDYEVSVPELDYLVEQAMTVKGVYGARTTGGGFGGCIVALTQPRSVEPLTEHLTRTYHDRFGKKPSVFATTATAGASVVE